VKSLSFLVLLLFSNILFSKEIEVLMKNKGSDGEKMVFEPALIKANVGDTIKFVATTSGHQVQSFKGVVPSECKFSIQNDGKAEKSGDCSKGATKNVIKSKIIKKNKAFTLTIKSEGYFPIMCKPHYAMGMVGLIVVGSPKDKETFKTALMSKERKGKKLKRKSLKRMNILLEQI
jgi:plastocyanin